MGLHDFLPLINYSRFESDPSRHELEYFSDPPTKKNFCHTPLPVQKKIGCRPPSPPLINSGTALRHSRAADWSHWLALAEIRTHLSFYACSFNLKVSKGLDWKQPRKNRKHHFQHHKSMGVFFRHSGADNSISCADKKGKHGFLDTQGQLNLWFRGWIWPISNSSELLYMSSSPASMKRIWSRTAEKKGLNNFSHYKSLGIFFWRSRAAYPAVGGPIWPNFELLRALLHVIVTCKYEKNGMKNSWDDVAT